MHDLVIAGAVAVLPSGPPVPADVAIRGGTIVAVTEPGLAGEACQVIDGRGKYLLPGAIDSHVHYGYGDPADDYRVETASAARAGVTTVIEYYRQTRSYLDLQEKIDVIESRAHINVGLHLALMGNEHIAEAREVAARFGVSSFKCWMSRRYYPEGAKILIQGVEEGELYTAMEAVAGIPGGVLALHAENLELCGVFRERVPREFERHLKGWHLARPATAEAVDILKAGYLASRTGCPIHIVHLGSREALEAVRVVRSWGVTITFETTPYFLTHTADDPAGTMAKVNPPVREQADVEAMWAAIAAGETDLVATDHAAKPLAEKRLDGTVWETAPGFPGTFTMLPVLLSEGVNKGRISLRRVVELVAEAPARLFGLPKKGRIEVGADADLILVDLSLARTVTPELQASVAPYSIYAGRTLTGWPTTTVLGGRVIMADDVVLNEPGDGAYVRRMPQ
jgi:dihydropyrimidinase